MSEVKEIVVAITGFLNQAFSAWEKYIETRQEAYNRKQDKRMRKCIDYAEQYIIYNSSFNKEDKELIKLKTKFFKLNN